MARVSKVLTYRLTRWLAVVAVGLVVISAALNGLEEIFGTTKGDALSEVVRRFNVVEEQTAQAWFSVLLLAAAAVLTFIHAQRSSRLGSRWSSRWRIIAVAFLWVSYDEAASVHELLNDADAEAGLMRYAWVFVAIPVVVALAAWIMPAVWALERRVRDLVIASGVVFVAGAVGAEILSGFVFGTNLLWGAISHVEEFLEMAGVILYLEAMLRLLEVERDSDGRIALLSPMGSGPD